MTKQTWEQLAEVSNGTKALVATMREFQWHIAMELQPAIERLSAWWHEQHVDRVQSWPWYRIWWHTMTGHRR